MPTLFVPSIVEAAHPGSNTDRLYVCQGSGADRDRYIKRLDMFTDQMPAWAGSLGTPAHDTSSVFDTTARALVLDKDGVPKKADLAFLGVRGYRMPNTGTYALKWKGATGAGSSTDASVSAVTGASATARSGITMSTLYPTGSGMYQGSFAGLVAGSAGTIVSSARQLELGLAIDSVSTDPEDQMALFFALSLNSLVALALDDIFPVDALAFNPDAGTFARLHGQLVSNGAALSMKFFNGSGGLYKYSDFSTLLGASSFVFLRFSFSGLL